MRTTRLILAASVAASLIGAGCSAISPTQIGQTAGSIAGGAIAPGVGVPFGALVGTLAGLVVERHMDKAREQKERVELGQQLQTAAARPTVNAAELTGPMRRVWVDETVAQGRMIAGHFESRVIP